MILQFSHTGFHKTNVYLIKYAQKLCLLTPLRYYATKAA